MLRRSLAEQSSYLPSFYGFNQNEEGSGEEDVPRGPIQHCAERSLRFADAWVGFWKVRLCLSGMLCIIVPFLTLVTAVSLDVVASLTLNSPFTCSSSFCLAEKTNTNLIQGLQAESETREDVVRKLLGIDDDFSWESFLSIGTSHNDLPLLSALAEKGTIAGAADLLLLYGEIASGYSRVGMLTAAAEVAAEVGVAKGHVRIDPGWVVDVKKGLSGRFRELSGENVVRALCPVPVTSPMSNSPVLPCTAPRKTTLLGAPLGEGDLVPHVVHQTWIDADRRHVPGRWEQCVQSWTMPWSKELPVIRITWGNAFHEQMVRLVWDKTHLWWWRWLLPFDVQRFDTTRYALLVAMGGVYSDMDVGRRPRDWGELYKPGLIIPETGEHGTVTQDLLVAAPAHPFMDRLLQRIPNYSITTLPLAPFSKELCVFFSTSPFFVGIQLALYHLECSTSSTPPNLQYPPPTPTPIPSPLPTSPTPPSPSKPTLSSLIPNLPLGSCETMFGPLRLLTPAEFEGKRNAFVRHAVGGTWHDELSFWKNVETTLREARLFLPILVASSVVVAVISLFFCLVAIEFTCYRVMSMFACQFAKRPRNAHSE